MKKIRINFFIGLALLITGILIGQLAGHQHMAKGFIVGMVGFILAGASGLTLLQVGRRNRNKNQGSDLLDSDS